MKIQRKNVITLKQKSTYDVFECAQHVRVVEPLVIFASAYFAFLGAEVFHWSGIISIIAFGITVKRYAFQNLSKKSYTTVKYAIKTLATVRSEQINIDGQK